MKSKTLLAAIVLATAATTLSIMAVVPVAFADTSETETEIEGEQENNCSGFLYTCQGRADATFGLGIVRPPPPPPP